MIVRGAYLAGLLLVVACALFGARAGAAGPPVSDAPSSGITSGLLGECSVLQQRQQTRCYERGLLALVESSGDPAQALPRIDRQVHATGGVIETSCHVLMHEVGRTWAARHRITLENIFHFVPRSNDPGCSAGFGMGLTMYLGPELVADPRRALDTCAGLPTRFRAFTCVHGTGHALMRGYHGQLRYTVLACWKLGATNAPDCAQGAFHDYWISLGGGDDTTRPKNADESPRSVCGQYSLARPCWYRYFIERRSSVNVYQTDDIVELCRGLVRLQRAGCVSGASLLMSQSRVPVDHSLTCGGLTGTDTLNCLRGVVVPATAGRPSEQLRLIRTCRKLPTTTRWGCYAWFGRTLAVVTNGKFRNAGCGKLRAPHARHSCAAGADRSERPLRTFS